MKLNLIFLFEKECNTNVTYRMNIRRIEVFGPPWQSLFQSPTGS